MHVDMLHQLNLKPYNTTSYVMKILKKIESRKQIEDFEREVDTLRLE